VLHHLSLRHYGLWSLVLAVLISVTRWPLRSRYLFSWDAANFAQALDSYNVAFHRPHRPGYPLYVGAAWLVRGFVHDPNTAYVVLSLVASVAASMLLLGLAWRIGGRLVAGLSTALFATSANTWGHGEVAYPYCFFAVGGLAVAWCGVETRLGRRDLTVPGAALLGLGGGFRPDLVPFLLPLWFWASRRRGRRPLTAGGLTIAVVVAMWFVPMVALSGGWSAYLKTVTDYAEVWGTPVDAGLLPFTVALGRNVAELAGFSARSVGPVWALLVLFGAGGLLSPRRLAADPRLRVLLVWSAPALVFYVVVHIGNLGYLLSVLPAFAMIGALAANELVDELTTLFLPTHSLRVPLARALSIVVIAVSCMAEATIFLFSRGAVSLAEIRDVDTRLNATLQYLTVHDPNTTLVLAYDRFAQLQYYLSQYEAREHIRSLDDLLGPDTRPINRRDLVVPPGIDRIVVADLDLDSADRPTGLQRVDLGRGTSLYEGAVRAGDAVRVGYGFARISGPGVQAAPAAP
jgi:hypothetical protein